MNICTEHEEDIAHSGNDCPACEQIDSIEFDHQAEIDNLQERLRDEEDRNEDLLDQKEDLLEQIDELKET